MLNQKHANTNYGQVKNLTARTAVFSLLVIFLFLAGISFTILNPASILADDSDSDDNNTEDENFGTMGSGDICCNWMLNDEEDLINANPSGRVGIGDWDVGENLDKTFEVRGDQGIDGMLSVSDNVFTESFLQSDKLAREETAPNLALINPDGEIIEVPLSPDIANWLFRLQDQDYFEDEGYDFGMGDDGDGDDDFDPLMDELFFEYPYPGFYDPWCISGPLTWEQMGQSLLYADHCDEEAQVVVNRSEMWDDNTNFNVHGSSIFYDPDEDYMSTVNIRAANEETKAFSVQQHPWNSDVNTAIYGNGVIGARGIHITNDSYEYDYSEHELFVDGEGFFKDDMAVDGDIRARSIEVTQGDLWPDYVFDTDYNLMPLASLGEYIKQNRSLPNIPTAEEVEENDNRVDLGDMQRNILKQVEEQALYILDLHKEKKELEKEVEELREVQEEMDELKKRIEAIENGN